MGRLKMRDTTGHQTGQESLFGDVPLGPSLFFGNENPLTGQTSGHKAGQSGTNGTLPNSVDGTYAGGLTSETLPPNVPAIGRGFSDVSASIPPEPLDTPLDWFDRIARRQAEWRDLGPEQALRTWHSRGEASRHVLNAMGVTP